MKKFGLEVITPKAEEMNEINRIIFQELCIGRVIPESLEALFASIQYFQSQGAEAAILGCTELGEVMIGTDSLLPLYDSTSLHVNKAVEFALSE